MAGAIILLFPPLLDLTQGALPFADRRGMPRARASRPFSGNSIGRQASIHAAAPSSDRCAQALSVLARPTRRPMRAAPDRAPTLVPDDRRRVLHRRRSGVSHRPDKEDGSSPPAESFWRVDKSEAFGDHFGVGAILARSAASRRTGSGATLSIRSARLSSQLSIFSRASPVSLRQHVLEHPPIAASTGTHRRGRSPSGFGRARRERARPRASAPFRPIPDRR